MKSLNNKIIIAVFLLLVFISKINAQNEAANWVMYPSKFNFSDAISNVFSLNKDSFDFSSSISDRNGKLLFCTNGYRVWNKNIEKMDGGDNILNDLKFHTWGANSIPCVIVPSPADTNHYYIFGSIMTGQNFNLTSYAIVDVSLNSGLGKIVSKQNSVDSNTSNVIAAVKHCNNKDYWIVSYRQNTNSFVSFLLTETGVSKIKVESKIGDRRRFGINKTQMIKISPNGKFIAIVSNKDSNNTQHEELFLFNNKTGEIHTPLLDYKEIPNNFQQLGSIEFSADNSKFYIGNNKPEILQFDISKIDSTIIRKSMEIVAKSGSYMMQLASNHKIYICSNPIDCIEQPNKKGKACKYISNAIINGGGVFPFFVSSFFNQPAVIEKFCYGSPTIFKVLNHTIYDSIRWDFGDLASNKNFSTDTVAYHIYSNYGLFGGVLHMFKCGSESVYNFKVFISTPIKITFSTIKPICINEKPFKLKLAIPDSGIYLLNNMEIDSLLPYNIGVGKHLLKYQLVSDSGCVSFDSITIEIKPLPVAKIILSRSPLLCLGDSVIFSTNFSKNYWSTSDSSKNITVKKAGLYAVSVVDTFGCKNNSDTIKVELKDIPVAKIIASDTLICEGNEFTLTASGDGEYKWNNGQKGKQIFVKAKSTETHKLTVTNYCGNDEDTIKVVVLRTNSKAYPNPVRSILQIDLSECAGSKQMVQLYDESGKCILEFETDKKMEKIDMSHFAEGNYLLRLGTSKSSQVFKVQFVN